MTLLVLRFAVAPLLVVGGTQAQRRLGHALSGLLIGLPLTSLPLLWLVGLHLGARFAGNMAAAALAGTAAQSIVTWTYARVARRQPATRTMVTALSAFAATCGVIYVARPSVMVSALLGTAALLAALRFWPRDTPGELPDAPGRYRVGLRVLLAATFTLLITGLAGMMGPEAAGLVTAVPVLTLVMAFVTQRELGGEAAARFLHGVLKGSFSVVASLLVLSAVLPSGRLLLAFGAAVAAALIVQMVTLGLGRRQTSLATA